MTSCKTRCDREKKDKRSKTSCWKRGGETPHNNIISLLVVYMVPRVLHSRSMFTS